MNSKEPKHDKATGPDGARVLVAVDFSPDAEAAFLWACNYAKLADAPLVVLHVVHDPAEAPGYYRHTAEDALVPMQEVAAEMMTEFLEKMREQHVIVNDIAELDTVQVTGLPATRILDVAEQCAATLIVVGCQGRTGLKRLLIGSKAERLVQLSPIPVTVVKSDKA